MHTPSHVERASLVECTALSKGARLEFGIAPTGQQTLSVFRNRRLVASFNCQGGGTSRTVATTIPAANDQTMPQEPLKDEQWYDEGLLDEPIEPLPEFV
jgi:hypothetical protein